jgi:hypothetical protein
MRSLTRYLPLLFLCGASTLRADIAVVVHPHSPVSVLQLDDVKRIFNGKLRQLPASGVLLTVYDLPDDTPLFSRFYMLLYGMDAQRMNRRRAAYLFSGQGTIPTVMTDEAAMKAAVASGMMTIGYLDAGSVDHTVKVVLTLPE